MYVFNYCYITLYNDDRKIIIQSGSKIKVKKDNEEHIGYIHSINPLKLRLDDGIIMDISIDDMVDFDKSMTYSVRNNFVLCQNDVIFNIGDKIYFSEPMRNIIRQAATIREIDWSYANSEIKVVFEFTNKSKYILKHRVINWTSYANLIREGISLHPLSYSDRIYNFENIFIAIR